jgi:SAM-dependent methyltransferase
MAPWDEVQALCRSEELRRSVLRHAGLLESSQARARLDLAIHPDDQMLLHSLRSFDVNRAVSQYYSVGLQQYRAAEQVRAALFGRVAPGFAMLDFACGFGRLLRFMALAVPPAQIWASDIQSEAVEHVARTYGVHAMRSSAEPESFVPGRQFDLIWVASLFSHLAPHVFERWLARLVALLSPHGALCFSVHDASLLGPNFAMPAEGVRFVPESEIAELDNQVYGTTHVTEAFVRRCLARLAGPDHAVARIPRGLANEQDLYVVSRSARAAGLRIRRGPWGFVDIVEVGAGRRAYLTGWAASFDDGRADSVRITIDGRATNVPIQRERGDVAAAFGDARMAISGWEHHATLPGERAFVEASVLARGEEGLLYAGFL